MQPRSSNPIVQWNRAGVSLTFSSERAGRSVPRSGARDLGSGPHQPGPASPRPDWTAPALSLPPPVQLLPSRRCIFFSSMERVEMEGRISKEAERERSMVAGGGAWLLFDRLRSLASVRTSEPFVNLSGGILRNFNR
jgi:hypothetical protein